MKNTTHTRHRFEFLSDHGILINHVNSHYITSPSSYILNLFSFIDEAQRLKATKMLVMATSEVYHMELRMHEWVSKYLFPQMNHIGIKKIAFCVKKIADGQHDHKATFGCQPEIGIFTSMPEAKAWILDIPDKSSVELTFDLSESDSYSNSMAS